jgi:prepilin-type N-terminal cleavage/methylation domain-containing protein
MLKQLKKNNSKGFTIIEVMIVLAIAALILLIVFLAVPALQRSSRNTQRKNDVGRIGSAATTIVSNGNGLMSSLTRAAVVKEVGTTSYYDFSTAANLVVNIEATGGKGTNPNNKDIVDVEGNAKCSGSNTLYAARQIAVMYAVESGTGTTPVCIDQ